MLGNALNWILKKCGPLRCGKFDLHVLYIYIILLYFSTNLLFLTDSPLILYVHVLVLSIYMGIRLSKTYLSFEYCLFLLVEKTVIIVFDKTIIIVFSL